MPTNYEVFQPMTNLTWQCKCGRTCSHAFADCANYGARRDGATPAADAGSHETIKYALELLAKITPGEWIWMQRNVWGADVFVSPDEGGNPEAGRLLAAVATNRPAMDANAQFIAAAPRLMRELVALATSASAPAANAGICMFCDGCGWCEGSPAFTCPRCKGTGAASAPAAPQEMKSVVLSLASHIKAMAVFVPTDDGRRTSVAMADAAIALVMAEMADAE